MYRVRQKIQDDDEDTHLIYAFVLGDYGKAHWYYQGESAITCPSPLNVLNDTYDHSGY